MRPFRATVETIAAYGLESVPMTPSLCRQIDTSHHHLLCHFLCPVPVQRLTLTNQCLHVDNTSCTACCQYPILLIPHAVNTALYSSSKRIAVCVWYIALKMYFVFLFTFQQTPETPQMHVFLSHRDVDDAPPPPSPPALREMLPPNWKMARDPEGRVYYFHNFTR